MTSVCPRCSTDRDQRDGPYFVCADCRWRWTVSITGTVYVQETWAAGEDTSPDMSRRLLASVEGLAQKLAAGPPASAPSGSRRSDFSEAEVERLRTVRAAVEGAYYNEGVPLAWLRVNGILLPPADEDS